jgi:hypothetical protein
VNDNRRTDYKTLLLPDKPARGVAFHAFHSLSLRRRGKPNGSSSQIPLTALDATDTTSHVEPTALAGGLPEKIIPNGPWLAPTTQGATHQSSM